MTPLLLRGRGVRIPRADASCQHAMVMGYTVRISASQKACNTSNIVSACDQAAR